MSIKEKLLLLKNIYFKEFLYFRMPKVASETIRSKLKLDKRTFILPHSYEPAQVRKLIKRSTAKYKFSFVRHPYARFYSAYKWSQRDITKSCYAPDIKQQTAIIKYDSMLDFAMHLDDFTNDFKDNFPIHFYPQSSFIYDKNKSLLDYVGKYENLKNDFTVVSKKMGIASTIKFGKKRKNPDK